MQPLTIVATRVTVQVYMLISVYSKTGTQTSRSSIQDLAEKKACEYAMPSGEVPATITSGYVAEPLIPIGKMDPAPLLPNQVLVFQFLKIFFCCAELQLENARGPSQPIGLENTQYSDGGR